MTFSKEKMLELGYKFYGYGGMCFCNFFTLLSLDFGIVLLFYGNVCSSIKLQLM